jgi:hypothetical protein
MGALLTGNHDLDLMPPSKMRPIKGIPRTARLRGGMLLAARREVYFGMKHRTEFAEARKAELSSRSGWRLVSDLENAWRDNFAADTLANIARAYAVTFESMVAVLRGEADALVPLDGRPAHAVPPPPADSFAALEEIHPADRPAVRQRLAEVQAMIRTARVHVPEGQLAGAQIFGAGTPEQRFWDAMAAQGADEAELAMMVAFGWAWDAAKGAQVPRNPG